MRASRWTIWSSLLVLAVLLGVAPGCPSGPASAPSAAGGVKIGAVVPLSGEHASFGLTQRNACEIAQEDAKKQGRRELTLVYGDSKLDKDLALKEYRRLVDQEKVVAFVEVTGSGCALALGPIAAADRVPIVSGIDTSPELTSKGGPFFFRVIASDAYSSKVLAKWAVEDKLDAAAIIVNQQNDWAVGFRAAVEAAYREAGGKIDPAAIVPVTDDTVDFGAALATLRDRSPKAIFVALMGKQAGLFVAQAADKGLTCPMFGVDNFAQQEFTEGAKGGRALARFVLPSDTKSAAAVEFEKRYKERFQRDADAIATKAYDAYVTLLTAIEAVGKGGGAVTGDAIRQALAGARVDGITGKISFDANNDLAEADCARFTLKADGSRVPAAR